MLGIVFTEFVDMVEEVFSPDVADIMLMRSVEELESKGAYTAVGDYSHEEMLHLVGVLSEITGAPVPDLVYAYGERLFGRFLDRYPEFFDGITDAYTFLNTVESHIHVEVRKLYANARPPSLVCEPAGPGAIDVIYRSERPFALLAKGLVAACIAHYGEDISVEFEDLSAGAMTHARFRLQQMAFAEL